MLDASRVRLDRKTKTLWTAGKLPGLLAPGRIVSGRGIGIGVEEESSVKDEEAGTGLPTLQAAPLPRKGYCYVVAAAFLWAASGSSGKYLFHGGVEPLDLVQMRATLAAAVLYGWLRLRHPRLLRIAPRDVLYFVVLGVAGMGMVQFTYFYAISKIKVAAAILLQYLAPIFIAVYGATFGREKLTLATLTAIFMAATGCYLVVGAYNLDLLSMNRMGILGGVGSALSLAFYSVYGERGMRRYNPWTVLFYALLFAAVFWNLASPPLGAFRHDYSLVQWGWIVYIGCMGTMVPFGLYFEGINLIRSTRASVTGTLEPILAGVISYFFLGEAFQSLQLFGGMLVVLAVVLLQLRREFDDETPVLIRSRRKI